MSTLPFVSCITPTRNRRRFIPALLRSFYAQDYEGGAELIIVEDGDENCEDLAFQVQFGMNDPMRDGSCVRYFRFEGTVGAKLNFAVEMAAGYICLRMDDDDWQMPNRISAQVAHLQLSGKPAVGLSSAIYYREGEDHGIEITGEPTDIMGFSHCFLREYGLAHPYPDKSLAEDMEFSRAAALHGDLSAISGLTCMVAREHEGNTSPRDAYRKDPVGSKLYAMFGEPDNYRRVPLSRFAATVGRA